MSGKGSDISRNKRTVCGVSERVFGNILCLVGVSVLTPDTLVLREVDSVPGFTVLFYRYIVFGTAILFFLIALRGRRSWETFCNVGTVGAIAGVVWGASNMLFTIAVQNTAVANVLVIVASNPMFASIFSWLLFREKMLLRTTITSFICFGSIALIFSSEISGGSGGTDNGGVSSGGSSLTGNLLALGASITQGVAFALLRFRTMQPNGDDPFLLMPCNIIAGYSVALVALCFDVQFNTPTGPQFGFLFIMGFITLGISLTLLVIGPSYLPASEVALYFLIETVLGPVWVYLGGFEKPPPLTIYGGIMLLLALFVNSVLGIREEQAAQLAAEAAAYASNANYAISDDNSGDHVNDHAHDNDNIITAAAAVRSGEYVDNPEAGVNLKNHSTITGSPVLPTSTRISDVIAHIRLSVDAFLDRIKVEQLLFGETPQPSSAAHTVSSKLLEIEIVEMESATMNVIHTISSPDREVD